MKNMECNLSHPAYSPGKHSDMTLVELAKQGHHDAYVELYNRHSSMAARAIRSIVKNREDTEDLLQETFLRAMVHLKGFDGRAAFSTWVTRIAINCSLMMLRSRRSHPEVSVYMQDEGDTWRHLDMPDDAPNPEELFFRSERQRHVRQAVEKLPRRLRVAVEIRHLRDMPVKQVAALAGISLPAAKSRLLRGRAALEKSITSSLLHAKKNVSMQPSSLRKVA